MTCCFKGQFSGLNIVAWSLLSVLGLTSYVNLYHPIHLIISLYHILILTWSILSVLCAMFYLMSSFIIHNYFRLGHYIGN